MDYCKEQLQNLKRISAEFDRSGYLCLDMNENPGAIDKDFFDGVIKELSPFDISMYPNTNNLREKIAAINGLNKEQIVITNGSDAAIKYTFESMFERGDKIVTPNPTFAMYDVYCKMYDLMQIKIDYSEDLTFPFDKFFNAIQKGVRAVVTLNPNNPIGTVFSESEMTQIIDRAKSIGAFVIIDEAYHYFYPYTFIDKVKHYNNVIVFRTFSKLCSMAGCRIGFAAANEEIIESIYKVRPTFDVNNVAIKFASKLLDSGIIPTLIQQEKEGREVLLSNLKENGVPFITHNGNYVFIDCGDQAKVIESKLKEQKILTKTYDLPLLSRFIRISTGSKEIMSQFFKIFQKIWEENI